MLQVTVRLAKDRRGRYATFQQIIKARMYDLPLPSARAPRPQHTNLHLNLPLFRAPFPRARFVASGSRSLIKGAMLICSAELFGFPSGDGHQLIPSSLPIERDGSELSKVEMRPHFLPRRRAFGLLRAMYNLFKHKVFLAKWIFKIKLIINKATAMAQPLAFADVGAQEVLDPCTA